ncbi:alpha-amylase [Alteromonas sp. 345S023]|uniref:Alpha-amylase n=1 Tax=Alteromonas profundi TaxID=2696062 RepID=A0A7X5LM59_9ALTE|nr:alpha-amylase family glycosyl hydrolase [Alteromonas profundi]NDV91958.1 alpha-amylase [Alteromonas profundi]
MQQYYSAVTPYKVTQPAWTKYGVIYQINTRQFSQQGNFQGVIDGLDRIAGLGVNCIWLMPIQPIGQMNRKGELGSPYAVKDYYGINPEFGSKSDFKRLVKEAHKRGLKVLIDWVPNHSAWDCDLVEKHPSWYAKDYKGDFRPSPWWDWSDIIEFDYAKPELREYMVNAMVYWVETFDIDGFRCDVAGYVPNDFWYQARQALDAIKPIFLLAEWEDRDLHERAFNMSYAWSWNETMHEVAHEKCALDRLRKYYSWNERAWPDNALRMTFVSNHDKNAWDGTQHEQFKEALPAAIVLSVLGEGMPLIHNGQEAGETKRLAFFERDPIEWQSHEIGQLYSDLIRFKKSVPALANGQYGGTMIQVPNTQMDAIFSFVRMDEGQKVFIVLNLSSKTVECEFKEPLFEGQYKQWNAQTPVNLSAGKTERFEPWSYAIWISTDVAG